MNSDVLTAFEHQLEKLPGFKISESHFRLGSKIHLSDFYYAKRFFQNSFYASRFAFLVAREIIRNYPPNDTNSNQHLTILGYGLYSELLISLIESYLKKHKKFHDEKIIINHDLIDDTVNLNRVKGYEVIHENLVIIVPIASTFSTSMKIEELIRKTNPGTNILSPHINVLLVSHGIIDRTIPNDIEKKFGWLNILPNNKIVKISAQFNEADNVKYRSQKYLVNLPSRWHEIQDCKICFPDIQNECEYNSKSDCNNCTKKKTKECLLSEKVLQKTDKDSVTPSLIFGFPSRRITPEIIPNEPLKIDTQSLKYGHIERGSNHFQFYFHIERVFQENKFELDEWLKTVKKYLIDNEIYSVTDNVLIVAPEHFTNTGFVNTVNELVFSNSANILHFNIQNNSVANFQTFSKSHIERSDKLFFVDDTLTTGATFLNTNYFIKHTRTNESFGFDACIFLIDRSDVFTYNNVLRKLDNKKNRILTYANIYLPSLNRFNADCQLCYERRRAIELFNKSFLDRIKTSFALRITKLKKKQIFSHTDEIIDSAEIINTLPGIISRRSQEEGLSKDLILDCLRATKNSIKPFESEEKYIMRAEAIHRLYTYFSFEENTKNFIEEENFSDWKKDLEKKTTGPFRKEILLKKQKNKRGILNSDSITLLKVLSYAPFNIYKPIREKVFFWILGLLNTQIGHIGEVLESENLSYEGVTESLSVF